MGNAPGDPVSCPITFLRNFPNVKHPAAPGRF
jgi:hypothetical protein